MRKNGILLFTETSDRGGMEIFSKTFLEGIIYYAKDVDFKVILLNNAFPPNIKFADQDRARLRFFCCGSRFKIIRNIKFILFFIRSLLFRKPDFIIANHIWFQKIYWFLTPLIRVNYGFMVYGVEAWNLSFIDKIIIRRSKVIGSCSDYTRRKIYDQMGIRDNIMLFSPAVLENKFFPKNRSAELVEEYGLRGSRILLTVARLASDEKYKGYDKVIQALPDIIKEVPDIKYLIVGSGDDTVRVKALAEKLGLDKYVIFCGFIPNDKIVDYYSLCDVFIMPSKGEGFGIVFLEALACGKPVIAGNKDASREALLNGKLGILIDPDNTSEIAGAVIKVLKKDVPDRLLDSNYLRKESLEAYGISKFMERTDDFLKILQSETIRS